MNRLPFVTSGGDSMGILLTILFVILFFKLTGLFFRVCGKLLGIILSLFGYAFIGMLAIAVLGVAMNALPILALVCIAAIIVAAVRN